MKRRDFFKTAGTGIAGAGILPMTAGASGKIEDPGNRYSDRWHRMGSNKLDTPVRKKSLNYDVAVIGGGIAGICAAVSAARHGVKVVLVQDRPVLGGNSSSEMRVTLNAGNTSLGRETGIVEEIQIENLYYNPQESYPIWDHVLYNFVKRQKNLDLILNAQAINASMKKNSIKSVVCWQLTSETEITINADVFIDCSGDGLIAAKAGAEYRTGREAKYEFGEHSAPEKADGWVMGDTIMMITKDMGKPVPFYPPEYAIPFDAEKAKKSGSRTISNLKQGYWWVELGSDYDVIAERERNRDKLMAYFYGLWDYIKNSGDFPQAKNIALDWVGSLPGRRESRRFMGDYILSQKDVDDFRKFPDAVGFGGWSFDEHAPGGIENLDAPGSYFHKRAENRLYQIPFRCLYSKNISNLMLAGRNISVTHIALSSTRIMGTCSTLGQAVGTASAMCIKKNVSPRDIALSHIDELQEQLLRDDSYIPGRPLKDKKDLARQSVSIEASSTSSGDVKLLTDGYIRDEKNEIHHWESLETNAKLQFNWDKKINLSEIEIVCDTNIYRGITMHKDPDTASKRGQIKAVPPELVKSMTTEALINNRWVEIGLISNNLTKLIRIKFNQIETTSVRLKFNKTWGHKTVKLFSVRCYA